MRAGADVLSRRFYLRWVMERPQHGIPVADRVCEIILVDLQVAGDCAEDLHPRSVEGRIKLLERILEARDLGRPDIVGHVGAESVALGQVATDVPEFLEVV